MNFPNILSISRIFLLIPIIFLFEYEFYFIFFNYFIIASVTDYLDGYFARKNNQTSNTRSIVRFIS